jgi:hypothetical protein
MAHLIAMDHVLSKGDDGKRQKTEEHPQERDLCRRDQFRPISCR